MNIPLSIKTSATAWFAAIAAGAAESALSVTELALTGDLDGDVVPNLAVRLLVYGIAIALTVRLLRGRRFSRLLLTVLLSVIGLASMVVPPAVELASGGSALVAFGADGPLGAAFVGVRLAHILLVIVATSAMHLPSASAFLRDSPSPRTLADATVMRPAP